jgi:Ala-tRNA(Pro) deacylase
MSLAVFKTSKEVVVPAKKLKEYLNNNNIKYVAIFHSQAYTAQEVAATAHIPGKKLAKTVMVKIDDKMAMAVLTAADKVDFDSLKEAVGASKVELASEQEFEDLFPGCEIGAMPPFGNLYEMQVFVEENLTEDTEIAFNAGSYTELIRLSYKDFERLVTPTVVKFSSNS